MSASKRLYVALAAEIRQYADSFERLSPEHIVVFNLTKSIAATLKADNTMFDKARFMRACGFPEGL